MPIRYRVDWHSLLDEQVSFFFEDEDTDFDSFEEAKDYVVEGLQRVIEGLTYVKEQVHRAEDFDNLDLGWWEPLIEEIDDEGDKNVQMELVRVPIWRTDDHMNEFE